MIKKLVFITLMLMASASLIVVVLETLETWVDSPMIIKLFHVEMIGFSMLAVLGLLYLWKEACDD